jgi:hypothetical protein
MASFTSGAICWQRILKANNYNIGARESLASIGLTIFGKYIPGKIWMIIGKAAYIGEKRSLPVDQLSSISLDAQFITLWIGLIFGSFGLLLINGLQIWGKIILFLWIGVTTLIFSDVARSSAKYLVKKILKKNITLPKLSIKSTLLVMPWFVVYWTLLSVGFYLFVHSLTSMDIPLSVGLGFPLAGTIGIMVLIAPGGLGVREAVMIGYLSLVGLPLSIATTISIASRLWYLVGEIFIFVFGLVIDRMNKLV